MVEGEEEYVVLNVKHLHLVFFSSGHNLRSQRRFRWTRTANRSKKVNTVWKRGIDSIHLRQSYRTVASRLQPLNHLSHACGLALEQPIHAKLFRSLTFGACNVHELTGQLVAAKCSDNETTIADLRCIQCPRVDMTMGCTEVD